MGLLVAAVRQAFYRAIYEPSKVSPQVLLSGCLPVLYFLRVLVRR